MQVELLARDRDVEPARDLHVLPARLPRAAVPPRDPSQRHGLEACQPRVGRPVEHEAHVGPEHGLRLGRVVLRPALGPVRVALRAPLRAEAEPDLGLERLLLEVDARDGHVHHHPDDAVDVFDVADVVGVVGGQRLELVAEEVEVFVDEAIVGAAVGAAAADDLVEPSDVEGADLREVPFPGRLVLRRRVQHERLLGLDVARRLRLAVVVDVRRDVAVDVVHESLGAQLT